MSQATAARELAEARLAQATLRAPAAGRAIRRDVEPGVVVQPNRALPLLSLAIAGETRLIAQIDEKNLAGLALGEVAAASADAFPEQRFEATLFYLAPGVQADRGTVEGRFRVDRAPEFLRDDMTVSIEIVMGRRDNALTIPSAALREKDGQRFVLVINGHVATLREVKTGLSAPGTVEILSGLSAADQVITAGNVAAGTRVRPARARPKTASEAPPGMR
ncbi:MAG: efflux RND transporter periplasmic adaptor subunit [Deltaproteobacteria bacterium]|nr:efflux RND transporter periplasmic adaptor subunit [Deltaproteobacteria bacterium]